MNIPRVVVTGASSGIGRACAIRLAELGYEVYAGVRRETDGAALRAAAPERITPLMLDVSEGEAIRAAVAAVGPRPLAGLVNSAGVAVIGPLELLELDDVRHGFEVNVTGLLAVIQAFLPLLRLERGRIVNVGSIAGRSALPGTGAYDATKFAIEALTDALRMEMRPFGISVSVVEPGAVATPIWRKTEEDLHAVKTRTPADRYRLYEDLMAKMVAESARAQRSAIAPAAVVRAIEHALRARRPRTRYPVGWDAWFWLLLNLLPDRARDRLILDWL
jgi:NAD(P)-dependent dehydrogenase (short-subunit alcohol dehydrogenase family)